MKNNLYSKLAQMYYKLSTRKQHLLRDKDQIQAQLRIIEEMLNDINDILCQHGLHIYEHFDTSEGQINDKLNDYSN